MNTKEVHQFHKCLLSICFLIVRLFLDNNCKTLKKGAILTVNLTEKSLPNQPQGCGSESQIAKHEILRFSSQSTAAPRLTDFKQFIKRVGNLKLDIETKERNNSCYLAKKDFQYTVLKVEIIVEDNLSFAVRVFGWLLKPSCSFLKQSGCIFIDLTLSALMKDLQTAVLCSGINTRIVFVNGRDTFKAAGMATITAKITWNT